jgi:hypothetical protein
LFVEKVDIFVCDVFSFIFFLFSHKHDMPETKMRNTFISCYQ